MTVATTDKPLIEPDLTDAMQSLKTDIFRNLNCVKIGQIQSFDATKKTAQVQILFKRVVPDGTSPSGESIQNYPVLVDCPVFTLQGGGGYIQFPIAAGDQCLLLFCDRNLDAWYQNGAAAAPFDARCHDLSDAIALVGLNSLASTMPAYQANKLVIAYGGAELDLASGTITFRSATSNSEVDLGAGTAGIKNGSGGEVSINASSLIKIANNTTTIKTLLTQLSTILQALTVNTSTGVVQPATVSALAAWSTSLAGLFQ